MSKLVATAYHPVNGAAEEIWEGFSWPCFFFGCFWFGFKNMWGWAVLAFVAAIGTFGISWIICAFFANSLYATHLRKQGYLTETERDERKKASGSVLSGQRERGQSQIADEVAKLAALRDQGVLSEEEFASQKQKLLS
ncbi:MAG: SHOCT domain-containing protein [Chlorobium sp.]